MVLYALGTASCAFVTEMWQLIAFRIVASLGIGGEWAAGSAMVAEVVPEESARRGRRLVVHLRAARPVPRHFRERRGRGRLVCPRSGHVLAIRAVVRSAARRASLSSCACSSTSPSAGPRPPPTAAPARVREIFAPDMRARTVSALIVTFVALITWWTCNAFIQALANSARGCGSRHARPRCRRHRGAQTALDQDSPPLSSTGADSSARCSPFRSPSSSAAAPCTPSTSPARRAALLATFGLDLPSETRLLHVLLHRPHGVRRLRQLHVLSTRALPDAPAVHRQRLLLQHRPRRDGGRRLCGRRHRQIPPMATPPSSCARCS